MASSSSSKAYSPIVISNSSPASMMDVNQLQEYIKKNPSVLEKKHITINKIYTDGHSHSHSSNSSDSETECKKENKKVFVKEVEYNGIKDEEYVSKREIEIEKLDETIRYLKLDLNNEQVKNVEMKEELDEEKNLRESYEQTIEYVKDYVSFMENEPFNFVLNMKNITDYNCEIISSAKKYLDIEKAYKNLIRKENNIVESFIKTHHDKEIHQKFGEIKKSYENMNSSLVSIGKKFVFMKSLIFILLILNFFLSLRDFF